MSAEANATESAEPSIVTVAVENAYLLVPNTPVRVCLNCGMAYYHAALLKEIERRFFRIQDNSERPEHYLSIPKNPTPEGPPRSADPFGPTVSPVATVSTSSAAITLGYALG